MKVFARVFFMKTVALSTRPRRPRGQTLVEYALILAIISVVMIAVMALLSKQIVIIFSNVEALLDTAQGSH
jgi:Flp pilus assembly pilin Flp